MTKTRITFECESIAVAQEILEAVKQLKLKPYALTSFGGPIVNQDVNSTTEHYVDFAGERDGPQAPVAPPPAEATPKTNVSPGASAITKIGSGTKADLLTDLHNGSTIHSKWDEHLKLLWSRGEVKFDGEEWYL